MNPRTQTFISWKGDYPIHTHMGAYNFGDFAKVNVSSVDEK
jgi:hypothetical protein